MDATASRRVGQTAVNIAVLYICTGRFTLFWPEFFASCEEFFFQGERKEYVVFTDRPLAPCPPGIVHRIEQAQLGWPHDTLQRFSLFVGQADRLRNFDLVFFCNANVEFLRPVGREILPDNPDALIVTRHPGYADGDRRRFPYEDDPRSLACVPPDRGEVYVCGGFNGGYAPAYLRMAAALDANIRADMQAGIVARWHDESHLNRYILDNPYHLLPESYCRPQFSDTAEEIVRIRDKLCYGGAANLREGAPLKARCRDWLRYALYKVGLLPLLRRLRRRGGREGQS